MHLDRTISLSKANRNGINRGIIPPRIPKGINVTETDSTSGSGIEEVHLYEPFNESISLESQYPWSYLFIHNKKAENFARQLALDGRFNYFIHKTIYFQRSKKSRSIQEIEKPTVSGLVFIQGDAESIQEYLNENFAPYHLVKDCSTGKPAIITHSRMRPFMQIMKNDPTRIRFLLKPFSYYADGNTKLRIISGDMAGLEGYVIRIDRDRRLVMDVGGMTVAINGVHCEKFEIVKEEKDRKKAL